MAVRRLPGGNNLFPKLGRSGFPLELKALQKQLLALSESWAKDGVHTTKTR